MSSLNKRYCLSFLITMAISLIMIFMPFFNYRQKEIKESVHQSAEISFITVKKSAPKKILKEKQKENKVQEKENISSQNKAQEEIKKEIESTEENESNEESEGSDEILNEKAEKAFNTYKAYVLNRIASRKVYPASERAKGHEGRVKIHLKIDTDGSLEILEIVKESSHILLNQAALNSVKKASPFKKMPAELEKPLDFVFAMDFRLEQS